MCCICIYAKNTTTTIFHLFCDHILYLDSRLYFEDYIFFYNLCKVLFLPFFLHSFTLHKWCNCLIWQESLDEQLQNLRMCFYLLTASKFNNCDNNLSMIMTLDSEVSLKASQAMIIPFPQRILKRFLLRNCSKFLV